EEVKAQAWQCAALRAAGLRVVLIDPDPLRPWSQTFGVFVDELPDWLSPECFASRSETITAYTPQRQVLPRPYAALDNTRLRAALSLSEVTIVTASSVHADARRVTLSDGSTLTADVVVDASGRRASWNTAAPRQRAYGVIGHLDSDAETVLMDWRPPAPGTPTPPTFSYRVPLGDGRFLVEETFLAGSAPPVTEMARRWAARGTPPGWTGDRDTAPVEVVDFPLADDRRPPWIDDGQPLRFGAAGGLMHPATGYSLAASLRCADTVVEAIITGRDPRSALWPHRARAVYRLRHRGLAVLADLDASGTERFFTAFFSADAAAQRAYLGSRNDLAGVLRAMAATFAAADWSTRRTIATRAAARPDRQRMEQIADRSR
uniref:lycopene cyclase family protein n=1 Tax=Gordonia sp. (in: high G+C Gram-positive bacteria) TaxID=84139 RepID=UPI002BB1B171